ncbi:unnamed protein product [Nesidiocoris tenuis]|uniref:Uncharacterized protein n=1 Tax=Nesidiocoris tenuis TaxID=355587 RepID=A0A6H5FV11_9HEMI|nr:unnamed protein product [Nesidiocoris tenuis]
MEAEEANSRGDVLFQRGEYEKAFEKYRDAANLSAVATNLQNYLANRDKSQDEMVASNLKSSGDSFFERGEYSEAWRTYQRAIDASRVNKALYSTAKDRAKRETEAKKLNCQGNEFFEQGNYSEARTKFNEAHETSQTARDRSAYLLRETQAQAIVDTLSSLENSWSEAWKAENDGRDQEAAQLFQRVQDESDEAARAFSGVSKFRLYAALATLKIDGNDSFNQGLESQQKGVQLLREALNLRTRQNYETAHTNLEEARSCFTNAIAKFDEGSQNDERFASSIELVRELIEEVIRSIDLANREMQSTGMGNLRLDFSVADSWVTNVNNGDSKDYHANI